MDLGKVAVDVGACLNILKIAQEWINTKTRPESFCRNTNLAFEKNIKLG